MGPPQQPYPSQAFNQQQGFSSPPPPPQYGAGPGGALPVEDKSPLIALICGVVSWTGPGAVTAIPAIIFGVKGRRAAREGRTSNGGMATAGLWLGITNLVIGTLVTILFVVIIFAASTTTSASEVDLGLKVDVRGMASEQDVYIIKNPGKMGFEVPATSPGGKVPTNSGRIFTVHSGTVMAVKVGPKGYCVSAYNPGASRAKSPTASMVYRSGSGGLQSAVGVC